ncbi:MAG TPA: zinc metalloprotease HtpX [Stellaceae bacterium]|nr:zinc metalloprotease HtpX [Stellaceae bacterium]
MTGHFRTLVLISALMGLFMAVGYLIGGEGGMLIAFLLAAGTNLFAYWNGDKLVLSMYGAREVDASTAPELVGLVRELAGRAGLPMPRVYIVESEQPNAFATGRNPEHAAVAATTGILRILTRDELAGVLGHELTHVRNRDSMTMTIAATIAGAVGMLAHFAFFFGAGRGGDERGSPLGAVGAIAMMILAPLAATLVQLAISRGREFEADRGGAEISGNPMGLASALAKLEAGAQALPNLQAEQHPATAHLFIVNPLSGGGMQSLFSTHPSTERRIERLREIAGAMGQGSGWTSATATGRTAPQQHGSHSSGTVPSSGSAPRRAGPWG